jgi:hypothetical protein
MSSADKTSGGSHVTSPSAPAEALQLKIYRHGHHNITLFRGDCLCLSKVRRIWLLTTLQEASTQIYKSGAAWQDTLLDHRSPKFHSNFFAFEKSQGIIFNHLNFYIFNRNYLKQFRFFGMSLYAITDATYVRSHIRSHPTTRNDLITYLVLYDFERSSHIDSDRKACTCSATEL